MNAKVTRFELSSCGKDESFSHKRFRESRSSENSESLAESLGNRDQGSTVKISKPHICKDAEHDVDTLAHCLAHTSESHKLSSARYAFQAMR